MPSAVRSPLGTEAEPFAPFAIPEVIRHANAPGCQPLAAEIAGAPAAQAGLDRAAKDLKVETKALSAKANEPDTDKEERLRLLADGGYNPVIAVGFAYTAALTKVAKEFPDVHFQLIDGVIDGAANVEGHVFAAAFGASNAIGERTAPAKTKKVPAAPRASSSATRSHQGDAPAF